MGNAGETPWSGACPIKLGVLFTLESMGVLKVVVVGAKSFAPRSLSSFGSDALKASWLSEELNTL